MAKTIQQPKIYYLANFIYQPATGAATFPLTSKMFEFSGDKTPLECYDSIMEFLHRDSEGETLYRCAITDMKLI